MHTHLKNYLMVGVLGMLVMGCTTLRSVTTQKWLMQKDVPTFYVAYWERDCTFGNPNGWCTYGEAKIKQCQLKGDANNLACKDGGAASEIIN